MASLKERFKSGLKAMGEGAKQAGKMMASVATGGGVAKKSGIASAKAAAEKKKKLRAGRLKATGQTVKQATKIQDRVDARSSAFGAVAKRDAARKAKRRVEADKKKKAQDISRYGATSSTEIKGKKLLEQLTAKPKSKKNRGG